MYKANNGIYKTMFGVAIIALSFEWRGLHKRLTSSVFLLKLAEVVQYIALCPLPQPLVHILLMLGKELLR